MYGDCISYNYTSQGQKLAETVWNGSKTSRREYIGPMELLDGRHVRTNMPQGYFDSLGVFHAYIPDIQGNIAGVYEAKQGVTQLEQLNEYYAYGALTADSRGQDANRRRYTAKELTTDLGLNTYDFSARRQYPAVGRFDSPDSKTHEYRWLSPYAFCAGDPINFADPTGNVIIFVNGYIGFGSPTAGEPYWNGINSGFVKGAKHFFNDNNTLFLEVDHKILSSANDRFQAGFNYAKENIETIKNNMSPDETIKIVSHSMGGAYAEGMSECFLENEMSVSTVVHINAYQAGDISISNNLEEKITTIDYQNTDDIVINHPFSNSGKIKGASIEIREFSNRPLLEKHRAPIISGENFWLKLSELLNNYK